MHSSDCRVLRVAGADSWVFGRTDAEFERMQLLSNRIQVIEGEMPWKILHGATVLPPINSPAVLHDGVVVNEDGIVEAFSVRKQRGVVDADRSTTDLPKRAGVYLFGGLLIHQYGHFLLESLTRMWALKQHRVDGVVFVSASRGDPPKFADVTIKLLFGDVPVHVDTTPTVYDTLIVPDCAFRIRGSVYTRFLDTFEACPIPAATGVGKIYLSRGKLKARSERTFRFGEKCIVGETFLEETLARNGVRIVYPEEETIESQIALVRGSEAIGGLQGSALHNIVYAGNKDMFAVSRVNTFWTPAHVIDSVRSGRSTYVWPDDIASSGQLVPDLPDTAQKFSPRIIDPATALGRLSQAGFVNDLRSEDYLDARDATIAEYNLRKLCAIVDVGVASKDSTILDQAKALAAGYPVASVDRFRSEAEAFFRDVPEQDRTSHLWCEALTVV